jgi:hypothetical protein
MAPMDTDAYVAQVSDAYRAIGRHVVKFSLLVSRMRWLICWRLSARSSEPNNYAEVLFVDMAAGRVGDAFFSLCQLVAGYDDEERLVAAKLQNDVLKAVKFRNRIAHVDWWVGHAPYDADKINDPVYTTLKRMGKSDAHFAEDVTVPVRDLDKKTNQLLGLTNFVTEFGYLALGLPLGVYETDEDGETIVQHNQPGSEPSTIYRVRDVFKMGGLKQDQYVVREGPKAGILPSWGLPIV